MMKQNLDSIQKPGSRYTAKGTLWIECDGRRCFGPGRAQLLTAIAGTGSINKAARQMGMSYKKAWNMVQELNSQFTEIMVITQPGGEGGGGSVLTPAAQELVSYHEAMRLRFQQFLALENELLND